MQRIKCLSASALKIIAMVCMLLDHLWATLVPGNDWMHMLGRLAFPIFAFQVAEGFARTGDRKRYMRRLFVFALISEIPFNMMIAGGPIFPFYQNVMFTFWVALFCMGWMERGREEGGVRHVLAVLCWGLVGMLMGYLLMTDYYGYGVLTVLLFYMTREMEPWMKMPLQLAGMIAIHCVFMEGRQIPLELLGMAFEMPVQALAVLALIPIWLYNGEKGRGYAVIRHATYWFYPVHILILSVLGLYVL